jgi:hypothetical protein
LDERRARNIADRWYGGAGVVPRGPRRVLAVVPVTASEIEHHTGRHSLSTDGLWRIEVSGRFLQSHGTVYPGGVPFPEELHSRTAVIANEVWLYSDDDGEVIGAYWWPDAIRKPIASQPTSDFHPDDIVDPSDLGKEMDVAPKLPNKPWEPTVAVRLSSQEGIVFSTPGRIPDPLNEMVVYETGGVSLRTRVEKQRPDFEGFLRRNQPPFRRVTVARNAGVGRDPGRVLGPQTWPWPGELRWWENGVLYELRGFLPLTKLQAAASS